MRSLMIYSPRTNQIDGVFYHFPSSQLISIYLFCSNCGSSVSSMSESSGPESSTRSEARAPSQTTEDPIEKVSVYKQYGQDILATMRESEVIHHAQAFYVNRQPYITYHMRSTLIKWLFEFCYAENVESETMHLAVSYMDRFASGVIISKEEFQLVGATALFIAAKYEETSAIAVRDIVDVCGNVYTMEQVLNMEKRILKNLNYLTCVPTTVGFVNGFHEAVNSEPEVKAMSQYLIDLALAQGARYLGYLPSKMAAASIAVARINFDMALWSEQLEETTGYGLVQLGDAIMWLSQTHYKEWNAEEKPSSVFEEYATEKHMFVANMLPVVMSNQHHGQATANPI